MMIIFIMFSIVVCVIGIFAHDCSKISS